MLQGSMHCLCGLMKQSTVPFTLAPQCTCIYAQVLSWLSFGDSRICTKLSSQARILAFFYMVSAYTNFIFHHNTGLAIDNHLCVFLSFHMLCAT